MRRAIAGKILGDDGSLFRGEIVIDGETIESVSRDIGAAAVDSREDFGDSIILPGMVDAHVHCLSSTHEGVAAATMSAAAGGVTTIVEMPFDAPGPINTVDRLLKKMDLVRAEAYVDVAVLGTVVPEGGWTEIAGMVDNGAVGFKVSTFNTDSFRFPRSTESQFRDIMAAIAAADSIVCVHAESDAIIRPLIELEANVKSTDPAILAQVRPPVAEELGVMQVLATASEASARVHLCHLSVPRSVRLANWYRDSEGTDVSVETCPHYLVFDTSDVATLGSRLKINPPVRDSASREGMWDLLDSGSIDVISSDHAPWPIEDKNKPRMLDNHSGVPGVETIYPTIIDAAMKRGPHSLAKAIAAVTRNPAERYGFGDRKGQLVAGFDADIVVFDTSAPSQIDETKLHSNAGWSPYDGRKLSGRIVRSISRGKDIWDGTEVLSRAGDGVVVTPKR